MNAVIWLMYLADVAESLSVTLYIGGAVTLGAVGMYKLASFIEEFDPKPVKAYVIGAAGAFIVASIIPSKPTIYSAAVLAPFGLSHVSLSQGCARLPLSQGGIA